jgi:hypothetical protein
MPRHLSHSVEASSTRVAPPTPDVVATLSERERGHAGALPTHLDEAHAEKALGQEFYDHGASLSNTLNEAL